MAQKVVAARKAFEVVATTEVTVEGVLGRRLLDVFLLVTSEILRVQEALVAMLALVRTFRAVEVCLLVTTDDSHISIHVRQHRHPSRTKHARVGDNMVAKNLEYAQVPLCWREVDQTYFSSQARSKVFSHPSNRHG